MDAVPVMKPPEDLVGSRALNSVINEPLSFDIYPTALREIGDGDDRNRIIVERQETPS